MGAKDEYSLPSHRIDEMASSHGGSTVEFRPFKRWFPWLIPTFVVANVALFVATMYVNDCPKNLSKLANVKGADLPKCLFRDQLGRFSFQPFKENPLLGPSSPTLLRMGALEGTKVVNEGEKWRIFTCMWLHGGVFHVLANMLSLVLIGIRLEQEFGFVRIGTLYIVSGLGGSLLSALFIQSRISVGASGALFGLLGSMLSELLTNWTIYENKISALTILVITIGINLALGVLPHVDSFAHMGGFVAGLLFGFVVLIRPQFGYINNKSAPPRYRVVKRRKYKIYQIVLFVVALAVLIAGFVVGFWVLFKGVNINEKCSWCHYMSCLFNCKKSPQTCLSSQYGNNLNLTCEGTNKMRTYYLPDPNASDTIYQLCADLCT